MHHNDAVRGLKKWHESGSLADIRFVGDCIDSLEEIPEDLMVRLEAAERERDIAKKTVMRSDIRIGQLYRRIKEE